MPPQGRFVVGKYQIALAKLIVSGQVVFTKEGIGCSLNTWYKLRCDSFLVWLSPGKWLARDKECVEWAQKVISHKAKLRVRKPHYEYYQKIKLRRLAAVS